jgi:ribonuclease-3
LIRKLIPLVSFRSAADKKLYTSVKNITGLGPRNLQLYKQAFIHSSSNVKRSAGNLNNERLEFLGDAILGAVIGEYLFKKFPNKDEGFLTQLRSKIVNRKNLQHLALKFGLNNFLKTNLSKKDKLKSSAYGDAFEALIGALYLDLGYEDTRKFVINKIIKLHVDLDELLNSDTDFKSQLQIYCQKNKLDLQYDWVERHDPGQGKFYFVNVVINGKAFDGFEHYSKRVAEQKAAEIALNDIASG